MQKQSLRRLEAIPFSWKSLTDSQKEAVEFISSRLLEAINEIEEKNEKLDDYYCNFPVIDEKRHSQIAFIDGERGMGKSSVLLTIMKIIQNGTYPEDIDCKFNNIKLLIDRKNSIFFLETLDMEPLSKGSNLLASILVRIDFIFEKIISSKSIFSTCVLSEELNDIRNDIHKLQTDVAIIWERRDGGRHDGDQQSRALSILNAERAALNLNHRFNKLMEGLANALGKKFNNEKLLFVIAIDDFDLSPTHSLDILHIIRMISSQRLFFIISGNIKIAEHVLLLKSESNLRYLSGNSSSTDLTSFFSRDIAFNNLRKFIPPGQRVRLKKLRIDETLNIKVNKNSEKLVDIIESINFEPNQRLCNSNKSISMLEFIGTDLNKSLSIQNSNWLSCTPRQAVDFARMINSLRENNNPSTEKEKDQFLEKIINALIPLINDDASMFEIKKELISDIFDISSNLTIDIAPYISINVRKESARHLIFSREDFNSIEIQNPIKVNPISVFFKTHLGLGSSESKLTHNTSSLILFLHDIAISLWRGYISQGSIANKFQHEMGKICCTNWGKENPVAIEWPLPEWWTFRDYQLFYIRWSNYQSNNFNENRRAWIASILDIVLAKEIKQKDHAIKISTINEYIEELMLKKCEKFGEKVLMRTVISSIILLFAPEYSGTINTKINEEDEKILRLIIKISNFIGLDSDLVVKSRRAENFRKINKFDSYAKIKLGLYISEKSTFECILHESKNKNKSENENTDMSIVKKFLIFIKNIGTENSSKINEEISELYKNETIVDIFEYIFEEINSNIQKNNNIYRCAFDFDRITNNEFSFEKFDG